MNPGYVIPRVLRHFLPESLTRLLLLRSLIIKPGLETADPQAAVTRYTDALAERGESLKERRVLVFGYGGRFDIGLGLLEAGARYVTLMDRFACPDDRHNRRLISTHEMYFEADRERPRLHPRYIDLIEADVRTTQPPSAKNRFDVVVSTSVYEHLDDADGITRALAQWTSPDGLHIHFVDLRDHFFRYPFEMLRYTEETWRRWLDPTSHHNRLRVWDYRRLFASHFQATEIRVLARDEAAFNRVRPHIQPKFISGDAIEDAVTLIQVTASTPRVR